MPKYQVWHDYNEPLDPVTEWPATTIYDERDDLPLEQVARRAASYLLNEGTKEFNFIISTPKGTYHHVTVELTWEIKSQRSTTLDELKSL